jgi:hypothetical protein
MSYLVVNSLSMSIPIEIAAEAEPPERGSGAGFPRRTRLPDENAPGEPLAARNSQARNIVAGQLPARELTARQFPTHQLTTHQFPARPCPGNPFGVNPVQADRPAVDQTEETTDVPESLVLRTQHEEQALEEDRERERRTYRGRTVAMLRRYMRYSIETGRMPSLLGREFFRAKVTSYTVVTFEDRVIFVHDMEKCLDRLDEFSRQLIARHILQEHDRWATAKLLHCNEKTVRRYTPVVLDVLSEILIEVGLMKRLDSTPKNYCQEGERGPFDVSDCEDGKYKV